MLLPSLERIESPYILSAGDGQLRLNRFAFITTITVMYQFQPHYKFCHPK
jgi:hypothetical protein